jgi:hypothetical protein
MSFKGTCPELEIIPKWAGFMSRYKVTKSKEGREWCSVPNML